MATPRPAPPPKMNQSEAARHFGVTRQRIQNLERDGFIQRDSRKRYTTADLEAVFANMNPAVRENGKTTNGKAAPKTAADHERDLIEGEREIDAEAKAAVGEIPPVFQSKAAYEHWRAELARTKALEAQGALIPIEDVEQAMEAAGLVLRSQVMALGADLKPYLVEAGQAHLDRKLRSILDQVCDALEKVASLEDEGDDDEREAA